MFKNDIILHRLDKVESELDSAKASRHELYDRIEKLEQADKVNGERFDRINETLGQIRNMINKITADVQAILEKPAKKWDQVTMAIILGFIGIIVGVICGRIFP